MNTMMMAKKNKKSRTKEKKSIWNKSKILPLPTSYVENHKILPNHAIRLQIVKHFCRKSICVVCSDFEYSFKM